MALLELTDITMAFGGFRAVDGVTLAVEAGTITGLIGPNGAGKTTLFNVIAGLYRPTAGTVRFAGEIITHLPPHQRFRRGLVRTFQIPHEFQHLTLLENLLVVPPAQPGEQLWRNWFTPAHVAHYESQLRQRARDVLAFLELEHLADHPAGHLSGGQKKLLELGRTMMTEAKLVLLDEPAAGVNRTLLRKIEEKIEILNREWGYTFILIEHDMETVARLCDPVICMVEGQILTVGPFAAVRRDPRVLEAYLGETPHPETEAQIALLEQSEWAEEKLTPAPPP
ncbi:MAG: ABC transporter ATP-binding protein [Hydrogenophilus sp.]|nr:ABC transporter ATP-binding protein [Hydrogenophilus sp.]